MKDYVKYYVSDYRELGQKEFGVLWSFVGRSQEEVVVCRPVSRVAQSRRTVLILAVSLRAKILVIFGDRKLPIAGVFVRSGRREGHLATKTNATEAIIRY